MKFELINRNKMYLLNWLQFFIFTSIFIMLFIKSYNNSSCWDTARNYELIFGVKADPIDLNNECYIQIESSSGIKRISKDKALELANKELEKY